MQKKSPFFFSFKVTEASLKLNKDFNTFFTMLIHLRLSHFHVLIRNIDDSKILLTEVGLKQIRNIFPFRYWFFYCQRKTLCLKIDTFVKHLNVLYSCIMNAKSSRFEKAHDVFPKTVASKHNCFIFDHFLFSLFN